ncbi:hypothetical protein MPSEU_000756200 [Mayamaea pseudoterrestris]|nr:hypothetical protein MPSEU_000756200 [Mayamaea pseudoterrestris]
MAVPIVRKSSGSSLMKGNIMPLPPVPPATSSSSFSFYSLISHRSALRVTAFVMLLFGILGTAFPSKLYAEMMGESAVLLTEETKFFIFLFAIREIVMAAWLFGASTYLNDETCRMLLWSILLVLMPAECFLWLASRSFVAEKDVAKSLTNQAIFVSYLIVSAFFGGK